METIAIGKQLDAFVSAHARQDGWHVYKFEKSLNEEFSLGSLLDFLRDRHPGTIRKRFAVKEIAENDWLGATEEMAGLHGEGEHNVEKELNGAEWLGVLEIEWKGFAIHIQCVEHLESVFPVEHLVMVATKSHAALRDLRDALQDYVRSRERNKSHREVLVANGPSISVAPVTWDEVVLPAGMKEDIRANVRGFFQSQERYQRLRLPFRRGFLFSGPPGCGKTLTLKALLNTTDATFIAVHMRADLDESCIDRAFAMARKYAPAVVILEDLDRLVKSTELSMAYLLNALDGLRSLDGILVIATSNHPEDLDPALLHRPSRFDRVWKFSLPDEKLRYSLLSQKGHLCFSQEALTRAAEACGGFSMAYVQEIVVNALLQCAHEGVEPSDLHLFRSLAMLKTQRREASRPDDAIAERESLGFSIPSRRRPGLLLGGLGV